MCMVHLLQQMQLYGCYDIVKLIVDYYLDGLHRGTTISTVNVQQAEGLPLM